MLNLIKIEFKKNNMRHDILGAILANIGNFLLSTITAFVVGIKNLGEDSAIYYHIEQFVQLTSVVFIIYGTILIGELIIEEFKEGTCKRLFLYPHSREKIILSKVIIILIFTAISIALTLAIQLVIFVYSNRIFGFYTDLGINYILNNPISYLFALISAVGFVLCAFLIAYKSKSTIITLLIMIFLSGKTYATGALTSNDYSFIYSSITFLIGVISVIYVIKDVNIIDIE